MSLLVNDLLNLTRIENNSADIVSSEFNLSKAILNTALPFECQAFESNKKFVVEVQDGISLNASEQHIKQMAAIFIDNAIKHSGNNDEVKISLYKQGDKRIFSVFNTGSSIPENERDKIFERFYRSDASRARSTGGYGLGLAIAKSIIDFHKFKVNVSGVEGENVCFTVIM
jgi:signal transduction histidine kinase